MEPTNSERVHIEERKNQDDSSQSTPTLQKDQAEILDTKAFALKKIWSAMNMDVPTAMLMFKSVNPRCVVASGSDQVQGSMSTSHSYCNVCTSTYLPLSTSEISIVTKLPP